MLKRFCLPLLLLLWGPFSGCVPSTETVDCAKSPESVICAPPKTDPTPARIFVTPPFGLTFTCVLLGCHETLTLKVENRGGGTVALSEMTLLTPDGETPGDFHLHLSDVPIGEESRAIGPSLQPSGETPAEAGDGSPLYIRITYRPSDGQADQALLKLRWFDGRIPYHEAVSHTVELSVNARVLSTSEADLETPALNFGFSPLATTAVAPVELANVSHSDALLTVLDARFLDGTPDVFQIAPGRTPVVNPGSTLSLPIHFTPTEALSYRGELELITNDIVGYYIIPIMGTGHKDALLTLTLPAAAPLAPCSPRNAPCPTEAPSSLNFNHIRLGNVHTESVEITNHGGTATTVTLSLDQNDQVFSLPEGTDLSIGPLETVSVEISAAPRAGGAFAGTLRVLPSHPQHPLEVPLEGECDAPQLSMVAPLWFPPLVETWTSAPQSLSVINSGTGELLVTQAEFDVGSSPFFSFGGPLPVPITLGPEDPPLELPVVFHGGALGEATAAILLHTNSVERPIERVHVEGAVISCDQGCPTPNGDPQCYSGECEIGACHPGWHNTNERLVDGCECAEDRGSLGDVGGVCSTGVDLGTLGDCGSSYKSEVVQSGTLHDAGDVDLYFVRTEDTSSFCDFFYDSAQTSVELVGGPPGLALCAVIQEWGNGCGGYTSAFDPSVCGAPRYAYVSGWGGEDSRELTAWVVWRPDASPSCGTYTLRFRGEE